MIAAGLVEVIIYSSPDDKKKNRGFCFLEYESHKAASLAKRRLGTGRIKVNVNSDTLPVYHLWAPSEPSVSVMLCLFIIRAGMGL